MRVVLNSDSPRERVLGTCVRPGVAEPDCEPVVAEPDCEPVNNLFVAEGDNIWRGRPRRVGHF
jgi:hypothetical protein